ncbi:MAG TPA: esterase-like activity of phytase family protein, partial [Chroococcales cyanobacterium]
MSALRNLKRSQFQALRPLFSLLCVLAIALLSVLTVACTPVQARTAEARTFLNLSLDFLGDYQLPKTKYKDTPVGGLSALTYDRQRNKFYALSDDRSAFAPARFYTLGLSVK